MNELQKITIRIADVAPISLTIPRDSEEVVREAERNVNKVWSTWCRDFPDKNAKEVLAMVAYQFAKLYYQLQKQVDSQESLLAAFEAELDAVLVETARDKVADK